MAPLATTPDDEGGEPPCGDSPPSIGGVLCPYALYPRKSNSSSGTAAPDVAPKAL